jgi:hypothetical protein
MWKKAIVVCAEVLSKHFPAGTEEPYANQIPYNLYSELHFNPALREHGVLITRLIYLSVYGTALERQNVI